MDKILVALLATLALAVPAAAQDSDPQGSDHRPSDPQPSHGNDPQPASGNGTSGTQSTSSESSTSRSAGNGTAAPASRDQVVRLCTVVRSNVGDPSIPKSQWVMVDPDGCFQKVVYRILNWPPSPFRTS